MSGLWRDEISHEEEVVHHSLRSKDEEAGQPSWLSYRQECPISSAYFTGVFR